MSCACRGTELHAKGVSVLHLYTILLTSTKWCYRLASHFLPDFVLSQMIIATTTARNAANVTIA